MKFEEALLMMRKGCVVRMDKSEPVRLQHDMFEQNQHDPDNDDAPLFAKRTSWFPSGAELLAETWECVVDRYDFPTMFARASANGIARFRRDIVGWPHKYIRRAYPNGFFVSENDKGYVPTPNDLIAADWIVVIDS
jgi:hypothetical protein